MWRVMWPGPEKLESNFYVFSAFILHKGQVLSLRKSSAFLHDELMLDLKFCYTIWIALVVCIDVGGVSF